VAPLPLPIREAMDFEVTGREVNGLIQSFTPFPNPRRKVRRHDSICLKVNLPARKD